MTHPADVPVTLTRHPGTIHRLPQMPALTPAADVALEEIAAAIRALS